MKKKELQNIADAIVALTEQYTYLYFEQYGNKKLDKQLWAALHIGFLAGMKYMGADEDDVVKAFDIAHERIAAFTT